METTIEFKIGYLFGRLHDYRDFDFEEFIRYANEIIKNRKINLDIKLAEKICNEYMSSLGIVVKDGKEFILLDCIAYALYIKDNKMVIEDDGELVDELTLCLSSKDMDEDMDE
jgi:hypothetical protein